MLMRPGASEVVADGRDAARERPPADRPAAFTVDYVDDAVLAWELTPDGPVCHRDESYAPTIYVSGASRDALAEIRGHLVGFPDVIAAGFVTRRTGLRSDPEDVLRVDVADIDAVGAVASDVRGWGGPGEYRLYNVDVTREYRYCLENGLEAAPAVDPTVCTLTVPPERVSDGAVVPLELDGEVHDGSTRDALEAVHARLAAVDPDVLVVGSGALVPALYEAADRVDLASFDLGRRPGWQRLAGASTYESYGRVGHSPARYNVPGRALVDASTSFFWRQTNLDGLLDLVARSAKPLQEAAWASIGNVFTAIQIRTALDRGVLVPWNAWRHERFKPMSTLHAADRGGFTFSPDVGVHEDVHELDFSSLYPSIMVTRNLSPDTVRCDCHAGRENVPGLGYAVCDERGFLVDVLEPLVAARERYKAELRDTDDAERAAALRGRSAALKWILVSCFGYQGFSNAKFGRIECHEAINAYAREILLDAKETLEANGWAVVHGIVDSLWVRAVPGEAQTPLEDVAARVTADAGIPLEYEGRFDWLAFAPRRDGDAGALNRYFGKRADADEFKVRGIELRQRGTPPFVAECQREFLRLLDEHRRPEPVCDRLQVRLADLRAGRVDPADLAVRRRVSKRADEYAQYTRGVAALERAADRSFDVAPGEDVAYVVVDDDRRSRERVRLAFERPDNYDASFYADLLVRAAESVLSPFGWSRERIRRHLAETEDASITAF